MARLRRPFRRTGPAAEHTHRIDLLERRLTHLETLIEGLQDSVHRESVRRENEIHELQRKTDPSELSRALSQDARKRGIE
jgi:hypothetical protein